MTPYRTWLLDQIRDLLTLVPLNPARWLGQVAVLAALYAEWGDE